MNEEKKSVEETAEEIQSEAAGEQTAEEATETAGQPEDKGKGFRGRSARKESELKKELEALKKEKEDAVAAEKDRYLRLAAEYDNFRKRSQKERENVYSDAKADTVAQLLPVYDNLERALKAECADAAFYRGVEMTMTQLSEIFKKLGVEPVESVGKPFDPALHNAVLHTEDETLGENIIVEEFQKGFTLNGKIIRFAMVKVAN